MGPEASETPDLRDYLRLVWRRGWILLLSVIVIPLAAYQYTKSQPKVFESNTVLQVQAGVDSSLLNTPDFSPPQTNLDLVAAFVSTSAVSDEAAHRLGMPPGSLLGAASASADPDTGFVTITATGSSAEQSRAVAMAFAGALNATRRKAGLKRVDAAIASVEQSLKRAPKSDPVGRSQLQAQLQRLQTLKAAQSQNAQVLEPARRGAQTAPHPKRNASVAVILAILVGLALSALAERLDRRIHKPEELERLTGLPFLATIPHAAFPGGRDSAEVHEAFQTLSSSLTYFNPDDPITRLLVVSGLKGEGKTTVATNLAIAYATSGKRVILVDADLRKPDAAQRLGLNETAGLSQVLTGSVALSAALREVSPFGRGLRVLPAGNVPPNPAALLGSQRMASLLSELSADADLVILDTTPLLAVSDAFPLLDKVSGIVALVRLDKTPRDAIRRMLQIIVSAGGEVLGMVATDGKRRLRGGYGVGYGYGEGYGATPQATSDRAGTNGAAPVLQPSDEMGTPVGTESPPGSGRES